MFKKTIKRWFIPIALTLMLIIPVSANDVNFTETGICYYYTNVQTPQYKKWPINTGQYSNFGDTGWAGSFVRYNIKPDTTYKIHIAIQSSGQHAFGKTLYKVGSTTSAWSGSNTISSANVSNIDKSLVLLESQISGDLKIYNITFNSSQIGFNTEAERLLFFLFNPNGKGAETVSIANFEITATYDPSLEDMTQGIIDVIAQMNQRDEQYYTNALQVLESIKANQEQTNSKLDQLPQQIGDQLQQESDREKQEANTTGDNAVNQGKEALQGILDIDSLKDAIAPLITACSYDGTDSIWTFPSIKLPALSGIMEETSLNDEIQIDMTAYAEQYIPSVLLTLIRSLLTAGLIVYAIREVIIIVNNVIPS